MRHNLNVPQMAMFVAITLAFQAVPLPPIGGGILRFAALPIILSGLILGPKAGFWVGAISDVLECMLFPRGKMYFPGFTLTQALTGAIPALIVKQSPPSFWSYFTAIAIGQSITKFLLVPAFILLIAPIHPLWLAYQTLLIQALITQSLHIPIYAWLCLLVMRHIEPLLDHGQPDSTCSAKDSSERS
ncbi:folate family ECF transporter S component [bacterium]|nr:folate family ECF transporter S component [bacterium]